MERRQLVRIIPQFLDRARNTSGTYIWDSANIVNEHTKQLRHENKKGRYGGGGELSIKAEPQDYYLFHWFKILCTKKPSWTVFKMQISLDLF